MSSGACLARHFWIAGAAVFETRLTPASSLQHGFGSTSARHAAGASAQISAPSLVCSGLSASKAGLQSNSRSGRSTHWHSLEGRCVSNAAGCLPACGRRWSGGPSPASQEWTPCHTADVRYAPQDSHSLFPNNSIKAWLGLTTQPEVKAPSSLLLLWKGSKQATGLLLSIASQQLQLFAEQPCEGSPASFSPSSLCSSIAWSTAAMHCQDGIRCGKYSTSEHQTGTIHMQMPLRVHLRLSDCPPHRIHQCVARAVVS